MANFSPDNFQLSQLLAINEIHGFIVYKWIDPHPHILKKPKTIHVLVMTNKQINRIQRVFQFRSSNMLRLLTKN